MISKELKYTFKYIDKCNMCGTGVDKFKIMGKRLNGSQGKKPHKKYGITTTVAKCTNCGLIFSNPLPIPNSIEDHYAIPPEDYWKESYFEVSDDYFLSFKLVLSEHNILKPGIKALDIGAGLGKSMIVLERNGIEAYGIEPSEPFYNRAIEKMGIKRERLQLSSAEDAEYPEEYFDFVTFGAVLEHLYDPTYAINRAMKWLKPKGLMQIEVPSSDWLINKMINFYYKMFDSDYVANISPMHVPFHLYEFTIKSFIEGGKLNNYKVDRYYYSVGNTYMPKVIDLFVKPVMELTNKGMQIEIWLQKNT